MAIERHERQIAELQRELEGLKQAGVARDEQQRIQRRMSGLEAEIKVQEMQESLARESAAKEQQTAKKRGLFRLW